MSFATVDCLIPDWPAPTNVRAIQTLRTGGVSQAPWHSLNLGDHVADDAAHVAANRASLRRVLPAEPLWLRQVHGVAVANADLTPDCPVPEADAAYSQQQGRVCTVMTADCLPVLFCDRAGTRVAAAHAGWRGLHGGVLENTIQAMGGVPDQLLAWLGPAIGPASFEVGDEVREAFVRKDAEAVTAFVAHRSGKWLCDLYQLARLRLRHAGVVSIYGGDFCTFSDTQRFFSYRRDSVTGRMASLIWLASRGSGV